MSADNWAICPRCVHRAKVESKARFQAAVDAYGKVPSDEYERLRAEAQTPIDEDSFQTFREDYEIYGASEGTIEVSYSGHCQVCGLGVDFKQRSLPQSFRDFVTLVDALPPTVKGCPNEL